MTNHSQQRLRDKHKRYDLIKKYQQHPTEEVKTKLVLQYEDLVYSLAKRFARHSSLLEDLAQVGMIGLLAALTRFDDSYGRSFESFAVPTIIGEMKRYLRDKTWSVHVPRRIKELGPKIKQAIEELTSKYQRSPQVFEIAQHLGVTEEEVLETLEMGRSYHALSVDSSIESDAEGSNLTLLDLMGQDDDGFEKVNQKLVLEKIFVVLTDREKHVLELTFFRGMSQKEAGEALRISQMHVSRLQRKALEKLRKALKREEKDSELIT